MLPMGRPVQHANLSSALDKIQIPRLDFIEFGTALRIMHPDFSIDGDTMSSEQPCSQYNLGNLTLTLGD